MRFLQTAGEANYCSYRATDTDPVLANIRGIPKFREIRAAGIACQKNFDAQRGAVTPGLLLTIPALARLQAKLTDLLPLVSS